MAGWNLWHGCKKYSEGCQNCYVYRTDSRYGRDSRELRKTTDFNLPLRKKRDGAYSIPSGELVYTCFTSDFFFDGADEWRAEAWDIIRERADLKFLIITKRILRFESCLPPDWGDGWDNVIICCTVENQRRADERLPAFLEAPIKHKLIICEPLLERMNIEKYLGGWIESVTVGGESGTYARECDYSWVLELREQCIKRGVSFCFRQTGYRFRKDGRLYLVDRSKQSSQARKAGIDFSSEDTE